MSLKTMRWQFHTNPSDSAMCKRVDIGNFVGLHITGHSSLEDSRTRAVLGKDWRRKNRQIGFKAPLNGLYLVRDLRYVNSSKRGRKASALEYQRQKYREEERGDLDSDCKE